MRRLVQLLHAGGAWLRLAVSLDDRLTGIERDLDELRMLLVSTTPPAPTSTSSAARATAAAPICSASPAARHSKVNAQTAPAKSSRRCGHPRALPHQDLTHDRGSEWPRPTRVVCTSDARVRRPRCPVDRAASRRRTHSV